LLLKLNVICEQRWIQLQKSHSRVVTFDGKIYTTLTFSKPVKSDHN